MKARADEDKTPTSQMQLNMSNQEAISRRVFHYLSYHVNTDSNSSEPKNTIKKMCLWNTNAASGNKVRIGYF